MPEKGFAHLLLILVIMLVLAVGIGAFFITKNTALFPKASQNLDIDKVKTDSNEEDSSVSVKDEFTNPFDSTANPFEDSQDSYENPFTNL